MKKKLLSSLCGCAALMLGISDTYATTTITMDGYLSQVGKNNSAIASSVLTNKGTELKLRELDMVYSPFVYSTINSVNDKSGPGIGAIFSPTENKATVWDLGLNKKWSTGSTVTLGLNYSKIDSTYDTQTKQTLKGLQNFGLFINLPETSYELKPFVRIEQSLWKDLMARYTRSTADKTRAAAQAGRYIETLKQQQTLLKARIAYWSLSYTRQVIAFRKASLERTAKLLEWNENRVKLDLGNNGDLLQAKAGYKLRQLMLCQAMDDEQKAAREFNLMRNITGNIVDEELENLTNAATSYITVTNLTCTGTRADALAMKELYNSSLFAYKESLYRLGPELNVFGVASLHGLDSDSEKMLKQVTQADKPTYVVGLTAMMPLGFSTIKNAQDGYQADVNASRKSMENTEFSARESWNELVSSWGNVQKKLELAREAYNIQTERVANEQRMLEKGRSITFQLLTAQNDLDDTELTVYQLLLQQIIIYEQAKLFNTKP